VFGVLLSFMISSLDYNEVGLNYSGIFSSVEKKTFTSGIHLLGIGHYFLKFPTTVQSLEFSNNRGADLPTINCRTQDGLTLSLEVSYQFRIQQENLYSIYMRFGTDYKTYLLRETIDAISDVATRYPSVQFFTDRFPISQAMQVELAAALKTKAFMDVVFFQLRSVDLPDRYEDAIRKTEVTKQDIFKA